MENIIKIKPHHFIDIITSFSNTRIILSPHPYGHAVHTISERIIKEKDIILELNLGADDICQPCIHNKDGICDDIIDTSYRPNAPLSKREWNLIIDRRWCKRLNIKQGDKIPIMEFCCLLKENADALIEIYKENPVDLTLNREYNLKQGLKKYLQKKVKLVNYTSSSEANQANA
jgi:hypothetical protein